jgi:hypothetical protein
MHRVSPLIDIWITFECPRYIASFYFNLGENSLYHVSHSFTLIQHLWEKKTLLIFLLNVRETMNKYSCENTIEQKLQSTYWGKYIHFQITKNAYPLQLDDWTSYLFVSYKECMDMIKVIIHRLHDLRNI